MLVYQALKHLTGSVKVTHALDDHLFWEDRAEYLENEDEGETTSATQPSYASLATIGTAIWSPITVDGCGDYYVNPEELSYDGSCVGGDDKAFTRDHVTWLNHHPRETSHQELAVAFLVVSVNSKYMHDWLITGDANGFRSTAMSLGCMCITRRQLLLPTSANHRRLMSAKARSAARRLRPPSEPTAVAIWHRKSVEPIPVMDQGAIWWLGRKKPFSAMARCPVRGTLGSCLKRWE